MSQFDPSTYDPENAPEQTRKHIGRIVANHLTSVPVEYNEKLAATAGPDAWWALEVERLDAVFDDGTVPSGTFNGNGLMWKNDAGEPYGAGSPPTLLAKAFRECVRADGIPGGFTAWPGNPKSQELVGQVFLFEGKRIKMGKYEKYINFPIAHMGGADYVFPGEKKILTRRTEGVDSTGVTATAATAVDDSATEAKLIEVLVGKEPSQVFDAVLGDATLKTTPTFKGVNLIGAAADGSILNLLPLKVNGNGTLAVA